jgi:hypothetical protein
MLDFDEKREEGLEIFDFCVKGKKDELWINSNS